MWKCGIEAAYYNVSLESWVQVLGGVQNGTGGGVIGHILRLIGPKIGIDLLLECKVGYGLYIGHDGQY